ncbi:MAG: hypothetical protein ACXVP0_09600 [Bacteroidia bacterium]
MELDDIKERMDNFWIGLAIGMLFPVFCFFCYWLFRYSYISFPVRFVKYLLQGQMLSATIKMCGLGNLLIFYYGLNSKMDKATKGIIVSVLVYVALVVIVTYYYEPDFI